MQTLRHRFMTTWYRSRYLVGFILIGFVSICLELALMYAVIPTEWPRPVRAGLALACGIGVGYLLNAKLNFQVAPKYLASTFMKYAAISVLSFSLNMAVIYYLHDTNESNYWWQRMATAGVLFLFAYGLHRCFTFDQARNLGIAVYASADEDVDMIFSAVGGSCDHVHVDLVDESMGENPAPVNLFKLRQARQLWPTHPIALHVMSSQPSRWLPAAWNDADWFLFHLDCEDSLYDLIFSCREKKKKVGIVWRLGNQQSQLMQYLPHVDFVMILGIAKPGQSGQKTCPEAIELVTILNSVRGRYGFELMFDGGVNPGNIADIEAKYVVSASAVLRADNPLLAVHEIRRSSHFPAKKAA